MPLDRRLKIAALVCSASLLWTTLPAGAQAPAPAAPKMGLDEEAKVKGEQLYGEGKYAAAAATFEELLKKYPASPFVAEATLRAGAAYLAAGEHDKALAILKKILDDKKLIAENPVLGEAAAGMIPQVVAAKAAKAKEPERTQGMTEAIKLFDEFLTKHPNSSEAEPTSYAKAVALYQVERFPEAAQVLQGNIQRYANSPTVMESQYLLALTIATVAGKTTGDARAEATAELQYAEAERLLREILQRRPSVILAWDTQYQLGELLLGRAGRIADREKQKAMFGRALESYRGVASKDAIQQTQQQYVTSLEGALRLPQYQNPQAREPLKRQIDRETGKLGEIKGRADQSVTAKLRIGQIFSILGRNDECRVLMSYLEQSGLLTEPEQKKMVLYTIARSYAAQKLADKAVEKYNAFQAAYKGDKIAQDLPLLIADIFLDPKRSDPEKATKYLNEAKEMYPESVGGVAALMQARVLMDQKKYDEALTILNDALAKNPSKDLAVDAEFYRATLYAQSGKPGEAIEAYKKIRDNYAGRPQAEQAHFQAGQLLGTADPKAAVVELKSFATKFPQSPLMPVALFEIGKAQVASGQKDAAEITFRDLAVKYPQSQPAPYTYFERAKILNDAQKSDQCLAVVKEFIEKYADNAALLYKAYDFMAQIFTSQKKSAEAIATYEEFVQKHKDDPNAAGALLKVSTLWKQHAEGQGPYFALGKDEVKRGAWHKGVDQSTAAAERLLTDFPDSPEVALALKNLLALQRLQQSVKLKTPAEVEKYFGDLAAKPGVKPGTKTKIVFTLAAYIFEKDKAKAFSQMASNYDEKLKFAPEDLDLYGLALIEAKKFEEAMKVYAKLAADYPLSSGGKGSREIQEAQATALFGEGKALQAKGETEAGAKKFKELEELYPWSSKMLEVNYGIALDLHDKKDDDAAVKRLLEVTKAQGASAELRARAMLLLGRIHEENKRYAEAIDNYVKIAVFYGGIEKIAAEGLWRGAQLLERQASGEIPMPTPPPAVKAQPKPAGTPASAKPGTPAPKPGTKPAAK